MPRLAHGSSIALLVVLIAGCADRPLPTDPDSHPDHPTPSFAKIRGGGFDAAGDVGSFGQDWPPTEWGLPPDIAQMPGADPRCGVQGHCSVGIITTSFAGLGLSPNFDPNSDESDQESCCFGVLSTTNFFSDAFDDGEFIVTRQSAIRSFFRLPPGGWQLQMDLAFLTGETGDAARNDFASVTIVPVSPAGSAVEVIRLEATDPLPWKPGGCQPQRLGGVTSRYPRCTDWKLYSVDVSRFGGQDIFVEIRVGEGGGDNRAATSLAVDNVKFVSVLFRPPLGPITAF
jgi:hypothetical protein